MKTTILTIGDEILIGQIINSNASWISDILSEHGIQTVWHLSVSDEKQAILEALDLGFSRSDLIIVTGGLGPTRDDVTKLALASYFQCGLQFSQETYELIQEIFAKRNIPITDAHREQCLLPEKATLLPNRMGTAPGMWFQEGEKYLASLPGVPYEMKYIMKNSVLPRLRTLERLIYRKKTIRTAGIGETSVAELIEPKLAGHDVSIAYLPSVGQVRLRLSKTGTDVSQVEKALENAVRDTLPAIEPYIYGYDDDLLEQHIGALLLQQKKFIGTAESCTGGFLAHAITSVSGSSQYFRGSIIAYSNSLKQSLLGVKESSLNEYGAVSSEVVREMVTGALDVLSCDIAVAVSGIAGPTGGTETKPVGTVWIAVGSKEEIITEKFLFTKDRVINIKYTAIYALVMVRKFLMGR